MIMKAEIVFIVSDFRLAKLIAPVPIIRRNHVVGVLSPRAGVRDTQLVSKNTCSHKDSFLVQNSFVNDDPCLIFIQE